MVLEGLIDRLYKVFDNKHEESEQDRYVHLIKTLRDCEIDEKIIKDLLTKIKNRGKIPWRIVAINELNTIFGRFNKVSDEKIRDVKIILFTGIQGSGKTTTIVKYALEMLIKYGKHRIGIIAADTFRAGSIDQLIQNCNVVGDSRIECMYIREEYDPIVVTKKGIKYFKGKYKKCIILIDSSGKNYQDKAIFKELRQLKKCIKHEDSHMKTILVLDATGGKSLPDHVYNFKRGIGINEIIVTKIDGLAKSSIIGSILHISSYSKIPISYLCNGEHIDLKYISRYNSREFVSKITGIPDTSKIEIISSRILEGNSSMADLLVSFKYILDNEPMFRPMLRFIPLPKEIDPDTMFVKIKGMMSILQSMTVAELNDKKFKRYLLEESRLRRLSLGSGRSVDTVKELFNSYDMFSKMNFKKMMEPMTNMFGNLMKKSNGMNNENGMVNGFNMGNMMNGFNMSSMFDMFSGKK